MTDPAPSAQGAPSDAPESEHALLKLALQLGPLLLFFLTYLFGQPLTPLFGWEAHPSGKLLVATALLLPTLALATLILWRIEKRMPMMHVVGLGLALLFGGATLWLQDGDFIKMKVTLFNILCAAVLLGGLVMGRSLLRHVFAEAFKLDEAGWRALTLRWGLFFLAAAVVNELIWRNLPENLWVYFKFPGLFIATLVFGLSQAPLINRHIVSEKDV